MTSNAPPPAAPSTVDLLFGQPPPPPGSTVESSKFLVQHNMSMLNGVLPVAQPASASVVREGEAAHSAYRGDDKPERNAGGSSAASGSNGGPGPQGYASTAAGAAPSIAGMSKIRPSAARGAAASAATDPTTATTTNTSRPQRIIVPQRVIQGGLDAKFETDPYGLRLHGLLTPQQYTEAMSALNHTLHPARANGVDTALLVTGPLLVPLAVWGVRHKGQAKKRKKLLKRAIDDFHRSYPHLLMRWNRRPASCLSIERRVMEVHGPAPGMEEWVSGGGGNGGSVGGVSSQRPMLMGEHVEAGEEDAFV